MISAILPLVFAAVTTVAPTPAPAASGAEPAVSVTLNHQTYDRGDRARVTVRVRDDGYVVVLHTDADGRVRVLFPVDPGDDNFMKAGQDYEIRGRGDRDAFQVTESGSGTVYAAVSLDPFHADEFVRNNHWDYTRLAGDSTTSSDPEVAMTNIVEQMADGAHFDYDVATYTVESAYASNNGAYVGPVSSGYSCFYGSWDPWCDGYYPSPSYFSLGFGYSRFGFGYPYYGYGFGFPRYGFGFGFGGGYYGGYYGGYNGGRGYGSTGYGYSVGHGWSYGHRPIILGPGGGYTVGSRSAFALAPRSVGFVNRATTVRGVSPLYGASRFNTNRGPTRGNNSPSDRYGRREMTGGENPGFRTRINDNRRPGSDVGNTRPMSRADGAPARAPARVERSGGDSRPTRVERAEPRSQPRSEPRSQPRSEPRSQPRSEGHSRAPSGQSHESRGGGGGGGGGGHHGGGGGGGGRRH